MKRIPLISLALLVILLSLTGCKDSPNNHPGDHGNGNETVIHDALSQGLSIPFTKGEDTAGITLKVTLDKDNKFKNVKVGDDVTSWFGNTLDKNVKAIIREVSSGPVTARNVEEHPTSITIGFEGTAETVSENISITIPEGFLYNHVGPVNVVIEGQVYTVRFSYPESKEPIVVKVKAGKVVAKPTTAQIGYKIDNWVFQIMKDEYPFDFSTPITKDINLWGKPKEYTVTFNYYDSTSTTRYVYEEQTVVAPTNTDRPEYVFEGWFLNGAKFDFNTKIKQDLTLEGKWSPKTYKVTFVYYSGKPNNVVEVESGKTVSAPTDTARSGFNFDGWYLDEAEFDFSTPISKDITLKGTWYDANSSIIVNWYVGNDKIKSTTAPLGGVITPIADPNDKKESIADTFKHWTSDPKTNDLFDFNTHKALENINLYAVWNELYVGSKYTLKEYIGTNDELKTNGIEIYIIAKRNNPDTQYSLPDDYPYKYIGIDNTHDLSYYIVETDHKNSDRYTSGVGAVLIPWSVNPDILTGGTGEGLGDGYFNTKKALEKKGSLFDVAGVKITTLWDWLLQFRSMIAGENGEHWFVPSSSEAWMIGPRNNSSSTGLCTYWSSTETNKNYYGVVAETAKYVFAHEFYRPSTQTLGKTDTCRARLCRGL